VSAKGANVYNSSRLSLAPLHAGGAEVVWTVSVQDRVTTFHDVGSGGIFERRSWNCQRPKAD